MNRSTPVIDCRGFNVWPWAGRAWIAFALPLLAAALAVALCGTTAAADSLQGLIPLEGKRELTGTFEPETWAPHPRAAAVCSKGKNGQVIIESNGTPFCCGGWQFAFGGIQGGQAYRISARVEHKNLPSAWDCLIAIVCWDQWKPNQIETGHKPWNYLLPRTVSDGVVDFQCVARAPEDAKRLTVRYILRWTDRGSSRWTAPTIEPTVLKPKAPVKVCVVNAPKGAQRVKIMPLSAGLELAEDVAKSVDLWGSLILEACRRKPQLVVTPEVVIGGKDRFEGAVTVPGPATQPFEQIAREHQAHLVLGLKERDGGAIYNSAVLISPAGKVQGVYRKVHLATGEGFSGILPGNGFPVFDTSIGRVGCMICMDTTVCESARLLALGGAEFICFPIMGDLRASRWSPGTPEFNEDVWKAIMRTRAIDNQVCMAIARNAVKGSCIINRKGDILAWNDGDQEVIEATVPAEDGYRVWNGGDFREVTFLLRRPHLYGAYTDRCGLGPWQPPPESPPR
jgi:predicted amidohydrolase